MMADDATHTAELIDGRAIAARVKTRVAAAAARLREQGVAPCLAVIRVGSDPSSEIYVRHKERAAAKAGIDSRHIHLPADISEQALNEVIQGLNVDDDVDALLLQLPLPDHLIPRRHIRAIAPEKDADGFHPLNLGRLIVWDSPLRPCTPAGVLQILQDRGEVLRGKHAVVISRSVIVGRPTAQLLLKHDATVTVCHRHTSDLASYVKQADIVVSATGVPSLVKGAWIKPGATVIDVGITRMDDGKLRGDVEFDEAVKRAGAITPVPGGVGPMTIAMLLCNAIIAARLRRGMDPDPDVNTRWQV